MKRKIAFITGITGQDGSYLAELLLQKDYKVYGLIRRSSTIITKNIDHIINNVDLIYGDLSSKLDHELVLINPDEIYNLGSMSHVRISFDVPEYTLDINACGVLRLLECVRHHIPNTKFYHASSSEMFGMAKPPQNELSPFLPCSPYGVAKLAAYWLVRTYRDAYHLFVSNGICFNHESPRRGENFVTKKIVRAAVRIKLYKQDELILGNLDAKRDWGFAGDYVKAMYMILQHNKPDDFVIATGENYSVYEFMKKVFTRLDMDYAQYVDWNLERYLRPKEVPELCGDATKIRTELGWKPEVNVDQLIDMMIKSAMEEECRN
jgi:GDPmannose 4,6-dehydratase